MTIRELPPPVVIEPVRQPIAPPVDQNKVNAALQESRSALGVGGALGNHPELSPAERGTVVQSLIREGDTAAFYNAPFEANDPGLVQQKNLTTAEGINEALTNGYINSGDLLTLADAHGEGPQPLIGILNASPRSSEPGSSVETLGVALNDRADANEARLAGLDPNSDEGKALKEQVVQDRATAAIAFSSDPALASRNLGTPEAQREAFEALVEYASVDRSTNPLLTEQQATQLQDQALITAANLFNNNAQEMVDFYTSPDADPGPLQQFIAQSVFDPAAKDVSLSNGANLGDSVLGSLRTASTDIRSGLTSADPTTQMAAARQYGRLTSALEGATLVAATAYAEEVTQNSESRQAFTTAAGLVGGVLLDPASERLGPAGELLDVAVDGLLDTVAEGIYPDPEKLPESVNTPFGRQGRSEVIDAIVNADPNDTIANTEDGRAIADTDDRVVGYDSAYGANRAGDLNAVVRNLIVNGAEASGD